MDPEEQTEIGGQDLYCPECGSEETGYFCRSCGALLRGGEMVLCPRCHQVVPSGEFCNRCGQGLGELALSLAQLAMAGDTFWVTDATSMPVEALEPDILTPDESVALADAALPDWLQALPTESTPANVDLRIYPALRPIEEKGPTSGQGRFLTLAILLMGILLLGLMGLVAIILLGGWG